MCIHYNIFNIHYFIFNNIPPYKNRIDIITFLYEDMCSNLYDFRINGTSIISRNLIQNFYLTKK